MMGCFNRLGCWALIAAAIHYGTAIAQLPDYPDDNVAGIPVNYTDAKAGGDALPDPLTAANGTKVIDATAWEAKRRPEVLEFFTANQYGRAPGKPPALRFEVVEDAAPAFDGTATRKQIGIHLGEKDTDPTIQLLVYLPADAKGPVPLVLAINFTANNLMVDDPGVKIGQLWDREKHERIPATSGRSFGHIPVRDILDRGFGVAMFNYADVDPDAPGAIAAGVRQQFLAEGATEPAADEWGSIAAWAWGISRVVDYCETDPQIDARRIAIFGISRLGKTVLWAGAADPRIALVIASCSGEGGAALARRNYGETAAHLATPKRYAYQFAKNYQTLAADSAKAPMDSHEIIALLAPRPLLLQTGTEDKWSDPKGEFLAAVAATPVYELLGKKGIDTRTLPPPNTLVGDTLAYYMHAGGHGLVPGDWDVFLDFIEGHFREQ